MDEPVTVMSTSVPAAFHNPSDWGDVNGQVFTPSEINASLIMNLKENRQACKARN